jgi:rhodanese-related sulfurtransferase
MSNLSLAPRDLHLQLVRAADHHAPLVIDVRRQRQFLRARIAGSHNIPAGRLLSGEHPDHDLILIGARAGEAEAVAEALHQSGFHRRIQHLQAGLDLEGASRSGVWAQRRPWVLSLGVLGLGLAAQQADPALLLRATGLWLLLSLVGLALHRGSRQLLRRSA